MKDQIELEKAALEEGAMKLSKTREKNLEKGNATLNRPEFNLMARTVVPLSRAIEEWRTKTEADYAERDAKRKAPLQRDAAFRLIPELDDETAAYITMRTIIDTLYRTPALTTVSSMVGRRFEKEIAYGKIRTQKPHVWRRLMGTGRLTASSGADTHLRKALKWADIDHEPWNKRDHLRVGMQLVHLATSATGLMEIGNTTKPMQKRSPTATLSYSKAAVEWLEHAVIEDMSSHPWFLPMVEQPRDWTSFEEGGYLTSALTLVKRASLEYLEDTSVAAAMPVLNAVNALQRTPFAVQEDVLEVAEHVWREGWPVPGLPAGEEYALPDRTGILPGTEEHKLWKISAAKIHELNRTQRSKRSAIIETMRMGRMFKDDLIYFPMQVDWRGRIYTVPSHLTPMGMDIQRALLTFAEAKPLTTPQQWRWLKVQGANTWGNDKVSFGERARWVDENEGWILAVAEDPLSNRQWWDADKPFCFLAWALDYSQALRTGSSSCPIAMDGSCSGLQHYSAMLRDERGGAAVNLLPGVAPADVYTEVLNVVVELLTSPAVTTGDDSELAKEWERSGLLTRKLTKRPTMTTPYGVTVQGVFDQTHQYLKEHAAANGGNLPFTDHNGVKPANFMAQLIRQGIGTVVEASQQAMKALQDCAREVAKSGQHPEWVTPTGFRVVQHYPNMSNRQIKTLVNGKLYRPRLREEQPGVDKRKHVMGIAPNVIHSLDASHLVMSVNSMVEQSDSFVSFAMVHDSFGTHAADCPKFAEVLREEFVKLYTPDVLGSIMDQLHAQVPNAEEWPERPAYGNLDLEKVLESEFFFG